MLGTLPRRLIITVSVVLRSRPVLLACGVSVALLAGGTASALATTSSGSGGSSGSGSGTSGASSSGGTTTVRTTSGGSAQVSRGVCTTSLDDPQGRAASFNVRATRGAGSSGFGFAAVLEEKSPNGSWSTLKGSASPAGLGAYQPAASGAGAMVRRINVRGLRMGSSYRLRVTFRWVTASGTQTLTRRSSACTVKELRPNLGVSRSLGWSPGVSGGQVVYRARLRVSRAGSFSGKTVTLSVVQNGTLLGSATVQPLVHGATVLIPGARCVAGEDVSIRIDAAPTVEERTLDDNELEVACGSEPGARR